MGNVAVLNRPAQLMGLVANDGQALLEEIYAFAEKQAHNVSVEQRDTEAGFEMSFRMTVDPVPVDWAARASRLFRDLRAALDQLLAELLMLPDVAGEVVPLPRGPGFPVYFSETQFRKRLNGKHWRASTAALRIHTEAVIENVQPFHTHPDDPGSAPLWLLHDIANHDKHHSSSQLGLEAAKPILNQYEEDITVREIKIFEPPFKSGDQIAYLVGSVVGPHPKLMGSARVAVRPAFIDGPAKGFPVPGLIADAFIAVHDIFVRCGLGYAGKKIEWKTLIDFETGERTPFVPMSGDQPPNLL
jgi:hypothetical protein